MRAALSLTRILKLKSADPATGEEIGTIPEMGIKETREAIASAQNAFVSWKKTTAKVCAVVVINLLADSHKTVNLHHSNVMTYL